MSKAIDTIVNVLNKELKHICASKYPFVFFICNEKHLLESTEKSIVLAVLVCIYCQIYCHAVDHIQKSYLSALFCVFIIS